MNLCAFPPGAGSRFAGRVAHAIRNHRRNARVAGAPGYVYILFEHKSSADRYTAPQLLKYMARIWEPRLKQSVPSELPVILPLVICRGTGGWRFGNRLRNIFTPGQEGLYCFVPDYEYVLCDLSHLSDEQVRGGVVTRVMLLAMKHTFSDRLADKLRSIPHLLNTIADRERGVQCPHAMSRYIVEATDKLSREEFNSVLSHSISGVLRPGLIETSRSFSNSGSRSGVFPGFYARGVSDSESENRFGG